MTLHDTRVDTSGLPFNANAAAKAAGATPFKRPENGQFRPGSGFREFYLDATGDTDATSRANAGFGGWGGVYRLVQSAPGADTGRLNLFYAGDKAHTGLDNVRIHMSDGDPGTGGILGAEVPRPFENGWRLFWTRQHGDNYTWEIIANSAPGERD